MIKAFHRAYKYVFWPFTLLSTIQVFFSDAQYGITLADTFNYMLLMADTDNI